MAENTNEPKKGFFPKLGRFFKDFVFSILRTAKVVVNRVDDADPENQEKARKVDLRVTWDKTGSDFKKAFQKDAD